MKVRTGILIGLIFLGCSDHSTFRPGTYTAVKISKPEAGYLFLARGVTSYITGSEMVLNKDSSFTYTTCGNIMNGSWHSFKDSVFLTVTKNRWRIDSLEKSGLNGTWPVIPAKPIGFKCDNDYLVKIHLLKNGKKAIEKLKIRLPS